jgi:RNA 3'-terminal phosphate cyclase (ATP)
MMMNLVEPAGIILPMSKTWIEIDGSEGEGGGQMLRTGLALSVLTGQPVKFKNIRAKRSKPGLQAQHLASVQAVAAICAANVMGDQLGSQSVSFVPGKVQSGDYFFKIGTAGATALVLHTIYLPLLLRGQGASSVRIEGGTHALAAPSGEFLTITWAGYLESLGAKIDVKIARPGFFPKGGGLLQAEIQPASSLLPFESTEKLNKNSDQIECLASIGGKLPASIGERMIQQVKKRLGERCTGSVVEYPHAKSPGVVATLIDRRGRVPAVFFALGAKGKPSEAVADEAIDDYLAHRKTGCPVDPHSADQLLLPLAFAAGASAFRVSAITQHLLTQRDLLGRFIARKVDILGELGQPGEVKISS